MSRRFDRLSCANSARMASVRSFVLFFRESQHQLVKLPFPGKLRQLFGCEVCPV